MKAKSIIPILVVSLVAAISLYAAFALREKARLQENGDAHDEEEDAAWSGMDEAVVEKYASLSGRESSGPVLPVEGGDLLLFLFCLAGLAGGFAAGYCWRMLVSEGRASGGAGTKNA